MQSSVICGDLIDPVAPKELSVFFKNERSSFLKRLGDFVAINVASCMFGVFTPLFISQQYPVISL